MPLSDKCRNYPFIEFDPETHEGPFFIHPVRAELWNELQDDIMMLNRRGVMLGYALRHAVGVFHSLHGPIKYATSSNNYTRANHNHIFYLRDEGMRAVIDEAAKTTLERDAEKTLIDPLNEMSMEVGAAKAIYLFKTAFDLETINKDTIPLYYWMRDSCKGRVWRYGKAVAFDNEEDLVACKLKFA